MACLAINTAGIESDDDARAAIEAEAAATGLPADDPVRFGAEPLAEAILRGAQGKVKGGQGDKVIPIS